MSAGGARERSGLRRTVERGQGRCRGRGSLRSLSGPYHYSYCYYPYHFPCYYRHYVVTMSSIRPCMSLVIFYFARKRPYLVQLLLSSEGVAAAEGRSGRYQVLVTSLHFSYHVVVSSVCIRISAKVLITSSPRHYRVLMFPLSCRYVVRMRPYLVQLLLTSKGVAAAEGRSGRYQVIITSLPHPHIFLIMSPFCPYTSVSRPI